MKNRTLLIILIIGMFLTTVGALFKIMHWPGATILLALGLLIEFGAAAFIIIKLLRKSNRTGGFLDS